MANDNDSHHINNKKPVGGRPPGSKNKPKRCVAEICDELGFNPFEFLTHVANNNWQALGYESGETTISSKDGKPYSVDRISLDQRIKAAAQLSPHVAPTLRAVEHSGEIDVGVYEKIGQEAALRYAKAKSV